MFAFTITSEESALYTARGFMARGIAKEKCVERMDDEMKEREAQGSMVTRILVPAALIICR